MAKRTGRPNKYYTHVQPRLAEIETMCLNMTDKQIAETLGVAYSSFKEYKTKYKDLMAALKKGRETLVVDLKSTLINKAKGFSYEEKKTTIKGGFVVEEIIYTKYSPPDVAAINLLLKNYDRNNWANDPQALELRKKELELKEKQVEANVW